MLLDANKNICETASGNIFWVKNGEIFTPSKDLALIPGSIRERVIKLCKVKQGKFKIDVLKKADEVFMTNVSHLVLPFTEIKLFSKKYKI